MSDLGEEIDSGAVQNEDDAIINENDMSAAVELEVEMETNDVGEGRDVGEQEGEETAPIENQEEERRTISPIAFVEPISARSPPPAANKSPVEHSSPMTPTTQANLEPSATVKYLLEPSKQVITMACSLKTLVGQLRTQLASQIKMSNPDYIQLFLHDEG